MHRLMIAPRREPYAGARPVWIPVFLAVALVVLVASSDLKLRTRSADLALEGVVDVQILGELAIWGLIGLAMLSLFASTIVARNGRVIRLGTGLRLFNALVFLAISTSLSRGSLVSIVRAAQLAVLALSMVTAFRILSEDSEALSVFWRWFRRSLWLYVVVALIANGVTSAGGASIVTWTGFERYRWFASHPIQTGTTVGIALIALIGGYLAFQDSWFAKRFPSLLRVGLVVILSAFLVRTLARGSIIATGVGVLVMLWLSPFRRKARIAFLGLWAVAVVTFLVAGPTIESAFLRGQSVDDLVSLSGRDEIFALTLPLIAERPVLGHGYLAGRSIYLEAIPWAGESHNAFFEIGLSLGIIGLLLYAAMIVVVLRRVTLVVKRVETHGPGLMVREAGSFLVFLVTLGMVADSFAGSPGLSVMIFCVSLLVSDLHSRLAPHGENLPVRSGRTQLLSEPAAEPGASAQ